MASKPGMKGDIPKATKAWLSSGDTSFVGILRVRVFFAAGADEVVDCKSVKVGDFHTIGDVDEEVVSVPRSCHSPGCSSPRQNV